MPRHPTRGQRPKMARPSLGGDPADPRLLVMILRSVSRPRGLEAYLAWTRQYSATAALCTEAFGSSDVPPASPPYLPRMRRTAARYRGNACLEDAADGPPAGAVASRSHLLPPPHPLDDALQALEVEAVAQELLGDREEGVLWH